MPNHKKQHRRRRDPSSGNGSQLAADGKTFTLETPVPRTLMNRDPRSFILLQSFSGSSYFSTSLTNPTYTSLTVSLSQLDSAGSLTSVFDQYRLLEAEVWLTPQFSADGAAVQRGQISTVIDYDDTTNLVSFNAASDYGTCVTTSHTCGHYRHFVPHAALAAYAGAFTSYANVASPWLDAASSTVNHYGVKIAATPSLSANIQIFDLNVRLKVELRCVR